MRQFLLLLLALQPLLAEAPKEENQWTKLKAAADLALASNADRPDWLTRRGDARLFLGDAAGAVADFEKEITLDPARDAGHWRLGIAYHFAGQWKKSADQFKKYHDYDGHDRENGIWHFLATARVDGIEKARGEMLGYTQFDREPFPALYDMFAGKKKGADVLAEMKEKGQTDSPLVMFFAHYYIGLNEDLLGNKDAAKDHLKQAITLAEKSGAGGGPGYMGEVAKLHLAGMK